MSQQSNDKSISNWSKGANNVASPDRLPEGFAASGLNVDFRPDGKVSLRPGREQIAELDGARAALQCGDNAVIADGDRLKLFRAADFTLLDLAPIAPAGSFCGAELNGELFICTTDDHLRIRGDRVMPWGVEQVQSKVSQATGRLEAGVYRVALTAVTADGIESGTTPYVMHLPAGKTLVIEPSFPSDAASVRLYATVANGDTLYLQDERAAGSFVLDTVRDSTARLMTENLTSPPYCEQMCAHNSQLLMTAGNVLYFTEPFMPHLHHRLKGHISFPERIDVVVSLGSVIFVCADKTYAIQGLGTTEQSMPTVLGVGGVHGSGARTPDWRAVWMTKYGQAIGNPDGSVQLMTRNSYAPPVAESATTSVLEHEGLETIVTNMRGRIEHNGLGLSDHYELEID